MQMKQRYIERWMWMLLCVCCAACSSHDGAEAPPEVTDCFLTIYVYAPNQPMTTRAIGDVAASPEERYVHRLQIWVFKHTDDSSDGDLVGYLDATPTFLNEYPGNEMFKVKVKPEFADHPTHADVYVVANVESCELAFTETTTRDDLDAAMIGKDHFGVTSLVRSVQSEKGLPMSAALKNQPVIGSFPTLRIGTENEMATLELTRAVSKVRFVLCRIKEKETTNKRLVSIDGIQLDGGQIPTGTYLMPYSGSYASVGYEESAITYVDAANKLLKTAIPAVADPLGYAYESQSAEEYEALVNRGVEDGYLLYLDNAPTYLRESDKQLAGRVTYTISDHGEEKAGEVAEFSMSVPGDFRRNHSWIVYIYFMDTKIHVLTVTHIGVKEWTAGGEENHAVYNW